MDGNPRSIRGPPGTARLASADESEDERDEEQDERDPEEHPRAFHRRAGDAAKAKQRCDDGDDQEDNRPVQEISEIHDLPPTGSDFCT
jgi:hypothetical protein